MTDLTVMTDAKRIKRSPVFRAGIWLLVISCVMWFFLLVIPFLPLTLAQKGIVAGINYAVVQIAWWTGTAMVGPSAAAKVKAWFWRRWPGMKKSKQEDTAE